MGLLRLVLVGTLNQRAAGSIPARPTKFLMQSPIRHCRLLAALLLISVSLSACIGASGDVSRQGIDNSEVSLVVPLDRPFSFTAPQDRRSSAGGFLRGQVVSVHDGNTVTVLIDGRHEKVRLIGIHAAELDQSPWGEQARDALKTLIGEKTVRLETDVTKRDEDKRLLAYIYLGGVSVNAEMIRQGQAVLYTVPPNVAHVEDYRKAQQEAREAGLGVWNQAQPLGETLDCYRQPQEGREC
jgi:micrococcal nuclease